MSHFEKLHPLFPYLAAFYAEIKKCTLVKVKKRITLFVSSILCCVQPTKFSLLNEVLNAI